MKLLEENIILIFVVALGICPQRLRQQRANMEIELAHTERVLVTSGHTETGFLYCVQILCLDSRNSISHSHIETHWLQNKTCPRSQGES